MITLNDNSIAKTRTLFQSKELTPTQLVEQYYERIAQVEPSVKAFSYLKEKSDALASIDLSKENDENLSPLFGIPYGAKDIIHVNGLPLEAGSKIMKGNISNRDATIIKKLNKAGAILMGKTTTAEFASGGGPPKTGNAWNITHTPGGSSSGSAAGLAADLFLFSIGTQTSGSITRPAAYNGVVGFKPSFGQISKSGILPSSWSIDCVGIFVKHVSDLKYIYNEISGYDPKDSYTFPYKGKTLQLNAGNLSKKFKIGIINHEYFVATEDVMQAFKYASETLSNQGHRVQTCSMPDSFEQANLAHRMVIDCESAAYHGAYFAEKKDLFSSEIKKDIERGLGYSATDYLNAQETRHKFKTDFKEMFKDCDILITPASTETAPKGLGSTGSPKFNIPFSNVGVPTLTIPIQLSDQTGLPIGIQMIANFDCEQDLIDLGEQLQSILDFNSTIPGL